MYLLSQAQASALPRSNNCTDFYRRTRASIRGASLRSQLLTIARSGSNQTMNFAPDPVRRVGQRFRVRAGSGAVDNPVADAGRPVAAGEIRPARTSYQPASSQNTSGTMPNCLKRLISATANSSVRQPYSLHGAGSL